MAEEADSSPSTRCWVFKLGGSLLHLPGLAEKLSAVIRAISTRPLVVVGGGKAADLVREWGKLHSLDSITAHWLAVRAMEFNQHLIESLLPGAVSVFRPEEAANVWKQNGIAILNAFQWLQNEESEQETLPHSWNVTSDSIAAWAAIRWKAEGLLLLKSIEAPPDLSALRERGNDLVDEYFAQIAEQVPQIAWCNLRTGSQIKTASGGG